MKLIVRRAGERPGDGTWVELRRAGDEFEVRIGERVYHLDRVETNGSIRSFLIDGDQHELSIRPEGEHSYVVSGSGGMEVVEVLDPLTHLAEQSRADAGSAAAHRVTAYMPGRVVAVLVQEGDQVIAGQGVVVLEAMKMENEIQAESSGIVERILVEAGQPVEGGDALFEIG